MKKLFTLSLALFASVCVMAQGWDVGDDISDQLEWGDYDGTTDSGAYWKGSGATWDFNEWENFQTTDLDRYQIVYFPAGVYVFQCQGFYRDGSQSEAAANYFAGNSSTNCTIYADIVTLDENGEVAEVTKTYEKPICSNWAAESQIHVYETSEWTNDASYTYQDVTYWAPNCMEGASKYIEMGCYVNQVKLIVLNDGYVKLGIRKPGEYLGSDWVLYSNFRVFYEGDAGEAAQIELALDQLDDEMGKALTLGEEIRNNEYGSLASFLDDEIMGLDYDDTEVEAIQAAIQQVKDLYAEFQNYFAQAKALKTLASSIEGMLAASDYPGKAECQAALDAAIAVLNDGNGEEEITLDGPEDYVTALNNLRDARIAYIRSNGLAEDGSYDFTYLIASPWLCNMEYTPQLNEDGVYVFPEPIESEWFGSDKAWEVNASSGDGGGREHLPADQVVITSDQDAEYQWIKKLNVQSGWMGSIDNIVFSQGYCAVQQWSGDPITGYAELRQVLTGLPEGYYSMSAMYINAGNDISEGQFAYIATGEDWQNNMEKAQFTYKYGGWWGNTRDGWQTLKTGMIEAQDGRVVIGVRSDWFYAATGFHLYYYGETPDFSLMIQPKLDAAKAAAEEKLYYGGDIKAVNEILAAIELPLQGFEAYESALAVIAEANDYINTAYNTLNSFTAVDDYLTLQSNYSEESDEYQILDPAVNFTLSLGEGEDDTYLDAIEATEVCKAYTDYMNTRSYALSFDNAELNQILAEQAETLKAGYSTVEQLNQFITDLQTPINKSVFAQLGADSATEENPVDVSVLLVNPSFQYGPNYGWTGELLEGGSLSASINEYGRENAEVWNQGPFDFYQVVRALPAGAYEVKCRALYRDSGSVGDAYSGPYYNWWYEAGADMEYWNNKNAVLYVNNGEEERADYIKSVCDGLFEEPSFMGYFKITDAGYSVGNNGNFLFFDELTQEDKDGMYDPSTGEIFYDTTIDLDSPAYPFDSRVDDGDDVYYYPSSMAGVYKRMQMSPEAYCNAVQIMVPEGGNLRLGLRKDVAIGSDWLIFDDFQLLYLGTQTPTTVESIELSSADSATTYNLAGQTVNANYKGIVIKNGKKILNK